MSIAVNVSSRLTRRFFLPVFGCCIAACASLTSLPPVSPSFHAGYQEIWDGQFSRATPILIGSLRSDPAQPGRWCDVAEAMLANGTRDQAAWCAARAADRAPNLPHIGFRAA